MEVKLQITLIQYPPVSSKLKHRNEKLITKFQRRRRRSTCL